MVFFTCNHCGESLKKPAVEKHYTWKSCRNATPFLTCVDCLKDFRGDEFKAHTKCVTELQKYSAKGFVDKPDKNKGAQKQEAWTEIIQNHLVKRTDLDNHTTQTLQRIAAQTNVPRKKPKFINFLKSCMHISPHSAEKIWGVIEKALEEFKAQNEAAKAEQAALKSKLAKEAASTEEEPAKKKKKKQEKCSVTEEESSEQENVPKKKKKKDKQINDVTSTTDEAALENGSIENGRKKKNKKRKAEDSDFAANGDIKQKKIKQDISNGIETEGDAGTFEWKKTITDVLAEKQQMKLDKLKKKVLKKFATSNGSNAEITPKDEKKFTKHLEKLSKYIENDGETVKMIVK